ncbi:MAG: aromatic ring-opening dioxygenase LigA [Actinomycetia bacterium]|nr:aromatic ring-opening dioxygenase LigA [Actinomycetes bacterium]
MSDSSKSHKTVRVLAVLVIVSGVVFIIAAIGSWAAVKAQLTAENITVAEDAGRFAGEAVDGPFTAYEQANVINKHALAATGGKTYAELAQDDPARQTAMTASFLRASLFTSVLAFGVSAMAGGLGITLIIIGVALGFVDRDPDEADQGKTQAATS